MSDANYKFYRYPDLDARIGLGCSGDRLAVVLLAVGCSRSGKAGAYKYTRRNPDRRAAAARLLSSNGWLAEMHADWPCRYGGGPVVVRVGKSSNGAEEVAAGDVLASFRRGGNFVFHAWFNCVDEHAAAIAEALGLEPVANRGMAILLADGGVA